MKAIKHFMGTVILGLAILFSPTGNRAAAQSKFATPEAAAAALQQALKAGNQEKMQAIFGREWMKSSASGYPVAFTARSSSTRVSSSDSMCCSGQAFGPSDKALAGSG